MRYPTISLALAALAALALAMPSAARAQRPDASAAEAGGPADRDPRFPPPPGPPRFGIPPRAVLEQLDLNAAQRSRVAELRESSERKRIPLEADLRLAELDVRHEMEQESPDLAAIDDALEQVGSRRLAIAKLEVRAMLGLREILTPAQRSRLERLGPAPFLEGGRRPPADSDGEGPR